MENEPQKSIYPIILGSVLASAIVFGGLGYYLAKVTETDKSATTTPTTSTNVAQTLTTPEATVEATATPTATAIALASNMFDVAKLKAGDKVGDLTVKSVEPFQDDSSSSNPLPRTENVKVTFTGETTVTGNYEYLNNAEGIGGPNEICMTSLDEASLKKFPLGTGEKNAYFCFTNQDLAKSKITSTVGAKGTATVTIKNYTYVAYPSEVHSTAELIKVVSKK